MHRASCSYFDCGLCICDGHSRPLGRMITVHVTKADITFGKMFVTHTAGRGDSHSVAFHRVIMRDYQLYLERATKGKERYVYFCGQDARGRLVHLTVIASNITSVRFEEE